MSVCDRNLPNEQQIGPLQLAIHVVQNHHAGEQKSLWDKTTKRHTILNGNFLCLSCPSATFALQHGGCVPREWLAAKGLLMLTPPSPRPTGMWLLENSTCWKIFVLSQCDFCSPARRLCAHLWLAAKGLLMLTPPSPRPTGMWLLENFYYLKVTVQIKRLVFIHMAICRAYWLQGKAFTKRKNSTPAGFLWETNMADVSSVT